MAKTLAKLSGTKKIVACAILGILAAVFIIIRFYQPNSEPFAVYSEDDHSLTFYDRAIRPSEGVPYEGKAATYVYTTVNTKPKGNYESDQNSLDDKYWDSGTYRKRVEKVVVAEEIQFDDCARLFYHMGNCSSFDISKMKTMYCKDFGQMFGGCSSLTKIDLSDLNFDSAEYLDRMFRDCSSLASVDFGSANLSSVYDFNEMFSNCSNLQSLTISNPSFQNGYNFDSMFEGCSRLSYKCDEWDVPVAGSAISFAESAPKVNAPDWPSSCNTKKYRSGSISTGSSASGLTKKQTNSSGWKGLKADHTWKEYSYYDKDGDLVGKKTIYGDGYESTWIADDHDDEYTDLP